MANYKSGAQRHNDMMDRVFERARKLEKERLEKGEEPNPSLTSPEEAKKYGWEIKGREVKKIMAKKMKVNGKKITPKMEYRAKKAGFYKHGDPRFGDVYES